MPPSSGRFVDARPGPGTRVDDREVDLLLVGVEVEEELVGLVDDLGDAGVGTVDLVDDEDDRHLGLERLAQHEAGLRERALAGVHQQEHTVDHGQAALDLTAEVGVTRGVDDVQGDGVITLAVSDRHVFGEDGDALLALEIHRVHDSLGDVLADPESSGLPKHRVDESGLAVIDVSDDGEVSEVRTHRHVSQG